MESNSLLLSILSPVWRAIFSREIKSSSAKRKLLLEDRDLVPFKAAFRLACGQKAAARDFYELLEIGRVADCYVLEDVCRTVEWEAAKRLTASTAADILSGGSAPGLKALQQASRDLALTHFEEFVKTDGFMQLSEAELGDLLDEERLTAACEERVPEAVVRWIKGGACRALRGERLLRKVRFGAMEPGYVRTTAGDLLPGSSALSELVRARLARDAGEARPDGAPEAPGSGAGRPRGEMPVGWERYASNGPAAHELGSGPSADFEATAMTIVPGGFCLGGHGTGPGQRHRILRMDKAGGRKKALDIRVDASVQVPAMAWWRGWVACGTSIGVIVLVDSDRNGEAGRLEGHTDMIASLAVSRDGERLLSGSLDSTLRVWAGDAPASWRCERTVRLGSPVYAGCVVDCGARAAFASSEDIWVLRYGRDAPLGRTRKLLTGHAEGRHTDDVTALAAGKERLYSASLAGDIKAWSLSPEACIKTVTVYDRDSDEDGEWGKAVASMAVHAGQLVTGSDGQGHGRTCDVRVWDAGTLALLHMVRLRRGLGVLALVGDGGCVRGLIDGRMAVWGWASAEEGGKAGLDGVPPRQGTRYLQAAGVDCLDRRVPLL